MASVNSRGGKLFFDFRYRGQRCREYTKLDDTPPNRKRARQILERIEAEITLGSFDYATYFPKSNRVEQFRAHAEQIDRLKSAAPTFGEFTKTWYAENEVRWRYSHQVTISLTLRKYLVPEFGQIPLDQITRPQILAFRANLSKLPRENGKQGLTPARINKIMMPLRQILQEGADRFGFVSSFRGIKALKVPKTQVDPFSLEEVQLILDTVRADFRNYYTIRFFTGMRTGEVDGLKWQYVDFDRREILIRETWTQNRTEYTKNDGSQREIQMSQPVYNALKAQQQITGKGIYVFSTGTGNPLSHHNVTNRVWYPLLRYLDLKKRRPYQTRHTAATLWLAAGEAPEWIARQMGHTTTEMLFRVYSRYVPNLTRQDGSAFDRLIASRLDLSGTPAHDIPFSPPQPPRRGESS